LALELTQMIRSSVTIDWTQRESVQAEIRLKVKKILRKYGYPPDREKKACALPWIGPSSLPLVSYH
jgi:type I restriction enzyme, R subunit